MPNRAPVEGAESPRLPSRTEAFRHFATFAGPTQSQQHIKPLHEYVTARLVLEGGFAPDELRPRPPLRVAPGTNRLVYDPDHATSSEATILGGLKTKNVDIVATKAEIGPVLAISGRGMTGAFRNLTNRLEETIGECTNIHIGYPMLVFGYLFIARANRTDQHTAQTDAALAADGQPVEALLRFHAALTEMTGRLGVRNDFSRYEAVGMALVDTQQGLAGQLVEAFRPPTAGSTSTASSTRSTNATTSATSLVRLGSSRALVASLGQQIRRPFETGGRCLRSNRGSASTSSSPRSCRVQQPGRQRLKRLPALRSKRSTVRQLPRAAPPPAASARSAATPRRRCGRRPSSPVPPPGLRRSRAR